MAINKFFAKIGYGQILIKRDMTLKNRNNKMLTKCISPCSHPFFNLSAFLSTVKRNFSTSNKFFQSIKNPYEVLGVSQSADQKQIKSAYYALVKKYHPDQNSSPDAADRFKEIQQAYEILKDSKKKKNYDTNPSGYNQDVPFGSDAQYHHSSDSDFVNDSNFSDWIHSSSFFDELLRKSGYGTAKTVVQVNLQVSFLDAALGKSIDVTIDLDSSCDRCKGRRADPSPGSSSVCRACNGNGVIIQRRGNVISQTTCASCGGIGSTIKKLCTKCSGIGIIKSKKPTKVKIPPGAEDQSVVQQSIDGNIINFIISVSKDKNFTRKGMDIYSEVPITFLKALVGDEMSVKTIHGLRRIKIPPGTGSHSVVRLPGLGIRKANGGTGSHIFEIKINVPKKITEQQLNLIKKFYEEDNKIPISNTNNEANT